MAILMTADVPAFTAEMADGMNAQVGDQMQRAPGFVIHTNGPAENGWRVTEVWESEDHFNRWYEETIKPNLPPGVTPQISFRQLHEVLTAA